MGCLVILIGIGLCCIGHPCFGIALIVVGLLVSD